MTLPVFILDEPQAPLADAAIGAHMRLEGDEGRHAATVRRIGAGEKIDLVDGCGTRLTCEVESADKQGLDVRVLDADTEEAPATRLALVQALAKGGRDEQAIETCTEIGVDLVVPWQSDRAIVRWSGPKAVKGETKWGQVVRAAAKQARRAWIPEVAGLLDTKALAAWTAEVVAEGGLVLVCHEEEGAALSALVDAETDALAAAPVVAFVVGPEGGISPNEIAALTGAGARMVSLGRNVLRSSTAGAVAMTILGSRTGRF